MSSRNPTLYRYTQKQIEDLKVGDVAPNCMGTLLPIIRIRKYYDLHGRIVATYSLSKTQKNTLWQDRIVRTIPVIINYTLAQLDLLESGTTFVSNVVNHKFYP